jgi:hypothetical protein
MKRFISIGFSNLLRIVTDCDIRMVQAKQEGLNLERTYQLPAYFNNGHAMGACSHSIKKNAEAL